MEKASKLEHVQGFLENDELALTPKVNRISKTCQE